MSEQAVFVAHNGHFVATELARGPWDPGAQHGGAPAALLMRALEQLPSSDGLQMARVTYEFLRPVPLGELVVDASVARPGRRVQLLEAFLATPDGLELVRARALRVREAQAPAGSPDGVPLPPGPETGRENDMHPPHRPMFAPDAVEIRFVDGTFTGRGAATGWFRLSVPVVAGEEPSPLQRLAAAGDFGNGISAVLPWEDYVFINPDLTLYVEREPVGEWICLQSETRVAPDGVGVAESVLFDGSGRVGRALQALVVGPR
jgi:Thioesterase-like superfamily